jgi:hypothetical protein
MICRSRCCCRSTSRAASREFPDYFDPGARIVTVQGVTVAVEKLRYAGVVFRRLCDVRHELYMRGNQGTFANDRAVYSSQTPI